METSLGRQELAAVGPILHVGTMQLFPPGKKGTQRIAIGDDTGDVTAIEMKRGTATTVFKTSGESEPVSCLVMGGPLSSLDRVFCGNGSVVRGLSRKGKEFFRLSSGLTQAVTSLDVREAKLWLSAASTFSEFVDGTERGSIRLPSRVNTLMGAFVTRETESDCVLGCGDGSVKVVAGSEVLIEKSVQDGGGGGVGGVSALANLSSEASLSRVLLRSVDGRGLRDDERGRGALVGVQHFAAGTQSGRIVHVAATSSRMGNGWVLENTGSVRGGAVAAVAAMDATQDGVADLVVGRDDGLVQVLAVDGSGPKGAPGLVFRSSVGESVRSLTHGKVATAEFEEAVLCTHTGRIVSFTTESLAAKDDTDRFGRARGDVHRDERLKQLTTEISTLEKELAKEKEKAGFHEESGAAGGGGKGGGEGEVEEGGVSEDASHLASALGEEVRVGVSWVLVPEEIAYRLVLESPIRIESVLLRTKVPLELLDADTDTNDTGYILSTTSGALTADPGVTVATIRCQEPLTRLALRIRAPEGVGGDVELLITVATQPSAVAHASSFAILPLGLHKPVHALPPKVPVVETKKEIGTDEDGKEEEGEVGGEEEMMGVDAEELVGGGGEGIEGEGVMTMKEKKKTKSGDEVDLSTIESILESGWPMSCLSVTGSFTVVQMRDWLSLILDGLPDRAVIAENKSNGHKSPLHAKYESCAFGSHLVLEAGDGLLQVISDSPSALSIVREKLLETATTVGQRLDVRVDHKPHTTRRALDLILPRLTQALKPKRALDIVDAAREAFSAEPDPSFLSADVQEALTKGDRIRKEASKDPTKPLLLQGTIVDLFLDSSKLEAKEGAPDRVPELRRTLQHGSDQDIRDFFEK